MGLAVGMLFFGMAIGFVVGMQYIPHQIKKKNQQVIARIKELL